MDTVNSPGMTDIDVRASNVSLDRTIQTSVSDTVDYTLYQTPSFVRNTSKDKLDTVTNQLGVGFRPSGLSPEGPLYRPLSTSPRLAATPRLPSPRPLGTVVEVPASSSDGSDDNDTTHNKSNSNLHVADGNVNSDLSNENLTLSSSEEKTSAPQGGPFSLINGRQCNECYSTGAESTIQDANSSGNVSHNSTNTRLCEMASSLHIPDRVQTNPSDSRPSSRISAISDDGFRAWVRNNRLSGNYGGMTRPNEGEYEGSYMDKIKVVAGRLNLPTRRPSVQEWRDRVIDCPPGSMRTLGTNRKHSLEDFGDVKDESEAGEWSEERRERIDDALSWLRRELVYMKEQDQTLARCLVMLRHDIQQVKLAKSYAEHQESIEDAVDELEEQRHLAGHSDLPPEHFPTPLKQFGVTRMNINSRRFSVF